MRQLRDGAAWLGVLLLAAFLSPAGARAEDGPSCMDCHASRNLETTLPSGESLDLTVHEQRFLDSVHGQMAFACTDCHWGYDTSPHPGHEARTLREYQVHAAQACQGCHFEAAQAWEAGEHGRLLREQNLQSATCTDCHDAHQVQPAQALHGEGAADACAACHGPLVQAFEGSVHGQALLARDPDAPTCTTCHEPHGTEPVGTAAFRVRSVELCADCHGDAAMAESHGINPDVVDTYFDEFHGRSLRLTMATELGEWVSQAVCIDCHGVHGILPPEDPRAQVAPENLVATCSQCHPGATSNFVASFGGHIPPETSPLVRVIEIFYRIVIPVSAVGFLLYVGLDVAHRIRERRVKP